MEYHVAPTQWGLPSDGGVFSPDAFQGSEPCCSIYAQYNVLKYYGYTGTVEDLIREATENGWYDPENGARMEDIGKLLESHGVPCDVFVNANKFNLLNELAQGKKIIVAVDSGELWADNGYDELREMIEDVIPGGADHALVVSGFDATDPDNVKVTLTDSGSGQNAVSYPVEKFEDAWRDGRCTMIVPQEPPPAELNLPELEHFDYSLGHFANMGDLSYDDWFSQNQDEIETIDDFHVIESGDFENLEDAISDFYATSDTFLDENIL